MSLSLREEIYGLIETERDYQESKWGTEFDDRNTANDWAAYINRYAAKATGDFPPDSARVGIFERNMMKVAALAVAAIETSRRNGGPAPRHYDNARTITQSV